MGSLRRGSFAFVLLVRLFLAVFFVFVFADFLIVRFIGTSISDPSLPINIPVYVTSVTLETFIFAGQAASTSDRRETAIKHVAGRNI
jgi:uncharacterized membrane protein (DUF485 family)